MKVAVIGGGSTYTPELVKGLLDLGGSLPLGELWLMDIAPDRLAVVGGLAQRMAAARGMPFQVRLTSDLSQAVQGASYVLTQFRVGMMAARRADEYLGRRYGLIGQETTGVGGMSNALRTIPVVLQVAAAMREQAPGALLLNFANPSGLVMEALSRYAPDVPAVGLCNVPITAKMEILRGLEKALGTSIAAERAELDSLGLNHLSWHRGLTLDGRDLWPQVLETYLAELRVTRDPEWDPETVEALGMVPNDYLRYYYYTARMLAEQERWPPSRAEEVMGVERDLLRQYADPSLSELPAGLAKRGGAFYSTVAACLINAHHNDLGERQIVNVRQGGAVPGWPADWVLEMPCRVDRAGIHPLPADPLPPACFGLLAHVKSYELLTVEAAVHGDRGAAYQALLAHPLGPPADRVQAVLGDMLETHRAHLPQFWEGQGRQLSSGALSGIVSPGPAALRYFLGADVGGSKTHVLIADQTGRPVDFGQGGPGNPQEVGYAGMAEVLRAALDQALASAGLSREQIAGAGFGVAGYDWPSQEGPTLQAIAELGLSAPVELVNDTVLGLLAAGVEGPGVAVVSGTGCNCRGWDRTRQREGRVTGYGLSMGEAAGGSELVGKALQAIAHEWTRRGPATRLTQAFARHTGACSPAALLEGVLTGSIELDASAALLVFEVAQEGDPVAAGLVQWAGQELGEMVNAVIRQLEIETLEFDVVLVGSMFEVGAPLIEPMRRTVHALAPGARLMRLEVPPVVGAVLLGMEAAGVRPSAALREALGRAVGRLDR